MSKAVDAARVAAHGKKYVNVLGADIARHCLEIGLLDDILVLIAPVLLGDGTPLLRFAGGVITDPEPLTVASTATVTDLWFRVGAMSPYEPRPAS